MARDKLGPVEASKRWRARQRAALVNSALEVVTDPRSNRFEAQCARDFLAAKDPDTITIDHLTSDQLATLDVLLDLVLDGRTAGNEVLKVIAEPKSYSCERCKERRDADYLDLAGLDEDSRSALADFANDLRHAQDHEA